MGFNFGQNKFVQGYVEALPIYDSLKECAERIKQGKANAAILRWFGTNDNEKIKDILAKSQKMRSYFNLLSIDIGFRSLAQRTKNENAAAIDNIVNTLNPHNLARDAPVAAGEQLFPVMINEGFAKLKKFLPKLADETVSTADPGQSQLNTILHELSHLIIKTVDEKLTSGAIAYSASNARALAIESTTKALNNAENWGIFIEAVGYHKSS
jgi:cell fate (sporulation/competence/biofilm development) regulator YlbF (YheA/YmcA/DUF963 family)